MSKQVGLSDPSISRAGPRLEREWDRTVATVGLLKEVMSYGMVAVVIPLDDESSCRASDPIKDAGEQTVSGENLHRFFASPQPDLWPKPHLAAKVLSAISQGVIDEATFAKIFGHNVVSGELNGQIKRMIAPDLIARTVPDKPDSRLRKNGLTEKDRTQRKTVI
ncbi:MAG: hypothetical protein JJU20_13025 [Opitutales bacterium]|nr:hypothetical protein [Opitutales bacterium]